MIYDVFLFNSEFDLLDLRLAELSSAVDKFVIVESNVSMRGKPKPMHFWEQRHNYDMSRIVHFSFYASPYQESIDANREFESQTRTHIDKVFGPVIKDGDTVIFGDADEIVRADVVSGYLPEQGVMRLGFPFYYYFFNLQVHDEGDFKLNHFRPIMGGGIMFKKLGFDYMRWRFPAGHNAIGNAGWHFSYLGGYESLLNKIASHAEGASSDWIIGEDRKTIERRISEGKLYNGERQFIFVPVDETFPKAIRDDYERYVRMGYIKPV